MRRRILAVALATGALIAVGSTTAGSTPTGRPGPPVSTRTVEATGTALDGELGTVTAWCDPGEVVTGGGYSIGSINEASNAFVNGPTQGADGRWGWTVSVTNDPGIGADVTFFVTAICARGSGE